MDRACVVDVETRLSQSWTSKHRNWRKLVIEEGWVQKRLHDIGWSNKMMCRGWGKEEGMEKHRLYHCLGWREVLCSTGQA